jgi:hypothetical protein
MPTPSSARLAMPETTKSTQGLVTRPEEDRRGPKRAEDLDSAIKHDADKIVAVWFSAALQMWGKATAYAELIGVDLNHVRRMRQGEKSIPLRDVLPFMHCTEAVLALVVPMLDSIGFVAVPKQGPTKSEVQALGHDSMWDTLMYREHVYRLGEKRGWTREQIDQALRGEHPKDQP